jgi:hypothetical protein
MADHADGAAARFALAFKGCGADGLLVRFGWVFDR